MCPSETEGIFDRRFCDNDKGRIGEGKIEGARSWYRCPASRSCSSEFGKLVKKGELRILIRIKKGKEGVEKAREEQEVVGRWEEEKEWKK